MNNEKKLIKRNASHTLLNQLKDGVCFKYSEYIYLIAKVGNGVMLQSQLERYMFNFFNISKTTVARNIKELKFNDILQVEKLDRVNIIVLKKYAYRFIKEEEIGIKIQSKELSTPRMTEGRINKSAWLNEFILLTKIETKEIDNVTSLINYLRNNTTLTAGRNDKITCFNDFISNKNVNEGVRNNLKDEVSKINKNREYLLQNLIKATKEKNKSNIKKAKNSSRKEKDNFDLNRMFYNNLHVTSITNNRVVVTYFDINKTLNETKINWIIENIYKYFKQDIFTHSTYLDGLEPIIEIRLQLLVDTETTKKEVISLVIERENKLKIKNITEHLVITSSSLNISKNCFKNINIVK